MDIDKIDDIELLRSIVKGFMVKVKKEFVSDNKVTFKKFNKGEYYPFQKDSYHFEYDPYYLTIYSDDYLHHESFTYDEAKEYLDI